MSNHRRLSSAAVRPPAALLGIGPEAAPAWLSLCAALDRLTEAGRTPVCAAQPDQWSADAGAAARRDAAEACSYCPARRPCAAFADVADERFGVWGGTDRALRPRPRAAPTCEGVA